MKHWGMMKAAVDSRGMTPLISADAQQVLEKIENEIEGAPTKANFDPLMSMNNHWWSIGLKFFGIEIMGMDGPEDNEKHWCPICLLVEHAKGFDEKVDIDLVADQMREWCIGQELLPKPS